MRSVFIVCPTSSGLPPPPWFAAWSIVITPQRSPAWGPFGVAVSVKVAGGPATATTVTVYRVAISAGAGTLSAATVSAY